jgi:hypothetical protein
MSRSHELQIIALDEISPGAKIRVTVINDVHYLSVRDVIMHVCDKDNKAASKIWERLSLKTQIQSILLYKFPGQGQSEQPVIPFSVSIKLAMMLPGKHAMSCRVKFAEIISRYLDGDVSMCDEIKHNRLIGQKRSYSEFADDITKRMDSERNKHMPETQYIYASKTTALPGMLKIGKTENIKARLLGLNVSIKPKPHVLVAIVPTLNTKRDERLAHEHFASKRIAGEFFEVDESEVKQYFKDVILERYQKELFESMC